MFILVIYNSLYVPIELCFASGKHISHCIIDYLVDFLFILDMCAYLRTTYYNAENELVIDARAIWKKYVFSYWFIIDFLAVFPFELVVVGGACGSSDESGEGDQVAIISLLKALRLLRLLRFRKEIDKLGGANVLRTVVSLSAFLLVAHWMACLWWFIGRVTYDSDAARAVDGIVVCNGTHPCSWLRRMPTGAAKLSPDTSETRFEQQYLSSLYWSLTTLMKSPAIGPDGIPEKVFASLAIALGAIFYAFFLSTVQNNFASFTKAGAAKRDKLATLSSFGATKEVPKELTEKLVKVASSQYDWTTGLVNSSVLAQLPSHLRGDVALSLYTEVRGGATSLFNTLSTECAKGILMRLQNQLVLQNQVLIAKGEACSNLYIMLRGALRVTVGSGSLDPTAMSSSDDADPRACRGAGGQGGGEPSFQEIEAIGAQTGLVEPTNPRGLGRYPFWVVSTKKTFLLTISQGELTAALDGFKDDTIEVRKALVAEHRKLVDSLKIVEDADSPLALITAAEGQAQARVVTPEMLDRVAEVDRSVRASMDNIASIREDLQALPKIMELITTNPGIWTPHGTETSTNPASSNPASRTPHGTEA